MPSTRDRVDASPRLVLVFTTASAPEGEVVRSLLESQDIPVVVKGMSQGPYRLGATELYVPEGSEADARGIIGDAQVHGDGSR